MTYTSIVNAAVRAAMKSPCQSKRGASLFWDGEDRAISTGHNHQPQPFICDGSDRCKKDCGKTAIHAEQDAILGLSWIYGAGVCMLHAKARDGFPCASMAPSCLECSKLILEVGIEHMHLLHDPSAQMLPGAEVVGQVEGWQSAGVIGPLDVRRYSAVDFHRLTAEGWHRIELLGARP